MTGFNKATIIPVLAIDPEIQVEHPAISILPEQNVFFASVKDWLKPANFDLWREYVSEKQRKQLSAAEFALVHSFHSTGHIGREEQESKDILGQVAICLHVIRPTRNRSLLIQLKLADGGNADVFSFSHPPDHSPNLPQSNLLNTIRIRDLSLLQRSASKYLELVARPDQDFIRGVRYFMTAYSQVDDPVIQIMTWTAGIEALLSSAGVGLHEDVVSRLFQKIDPLWNIYEDEGFQQYLRVDVPLKEVARDLFKLRNKFVHGGWVPEEWAFKEARPVLSGTMEYADMLREAAAAILRKLLMDRLFTELGG